MFRPQQQQKLRSLIGAPIAPLIDLDVFAAPHVWQRQTGCDSSTRSSWLGQTGRPTDRQTHLPADRPSVSRAPPPSTTPTAAPSLCHPPHPTSPNSTCNSTRYSRNRRTRAASQSGHFGALRSSGWSGGTAAEADAMRVTGSHMVSAALLFAPLRNCAFWRL